MNLNNFTLKSQEAVQQAQQIAVGLGSQNIESGEWLAERQQNWVWIWKWIIRND